jgi:hypothetical protein
MVFKGCPRDPRNKAGPEATVYVIRINLAFQLRVALGVPVICHGVILAASEKVGLAISSVPTGTLEKLPLVISSGKDLKTNPGELLADKLDCRTPSLSKKIIMLLVAKSIVSLEYTP